MTLQNNQLTELPEGLENLTQLTDLILINNQLTNVKGLEKLDQLTYLNLNVNKLTDVKGLEKLTQLESLNLQRNSLTDVKGLEKLTQLTLLRLSYNHLTNVKGREKLTQLKLLELSYNQLTDVKGLEKLTKLRSLNLRDNRALTKAQINQLQKALPKCNIYHRLANLPLTKEESAKVIEAAIRKKLKKPTGELTKADYEKVPSLSRVNTQPRLSLTSVKGWRSSRS